MPSTITSAATVAGDHLPDQQGWDALLAAAGLRRVEWIDREGLFFLKAVLLRTDATHLP